MKVPGDIAVPNRISGTDAKTARIAPTAALQRRQEQTAAQVSPQGEAPGADVQLTPAGRHLAALEQSLRAQPAVDELRVAAVKQRLEGGDYRVDPQRVADRLLHLEAELQRGSQSRQPNP